MQSHKDKTGPADGVAMSALPPKADMARHGCYVRFVPTADIAAPEPERGHRRKSLPLAVNKDAYDYRRKGEHD
jgi:hypothetical protein